MLIVDTQVSIGAIAALAALVLIARDAGAFRNMPQRISARVRRLRR